LLDAEAVWLRNAQRYERSEARRDTRVGYYHRKLQAKRLARQGGAEDMKAPAADARMRAATSRWKLMVAAVRSDWLRMFPRPRWTLRASPLP
jgi:hypothetical protein